MSRGPTMTPTQEQVMDAESLGHLDDVAARPDTGKGKTQKARERQDQETEGP